MNEKKQDSKNLGSIEECKFIMYNSENSPVGIQIPNTPLPETSTWLFNVHYSDSAQVDQLVRPL